MSYSLPVRPELVEGHLSTGVSPEAGLAFDKLRPNGVLGTEADA
jgi:hypothetical protein